jgi:hypothetical protein
MRCFIFLLLIAALSCQKTGNGYVKGTVTESGTENPIGGVPVYVICVTQEAKGQSTFLYDTIQRGATDADGTFNIKYYNSRGWKYKNYVSTGLVKNYKYGNFEKELVYKKTAINFSLY